MKVIESKDVASELQTMANNLVSASLRQPLGNLVSIIRNGFDRNFDAAQGSSGTAWPKRKDNKPHPLLIETGALLVAARGGPGGVTQIGDRDMALGVDKSVGEGGVPGAAVHNFGFPKLNIPQREFLYASDETLDVAAAFFAEDCLTTLFVF